MYQLDTKLVILIIVIVLIVVVGLMLFRRMYCTEEEREEHRWKLIAGILVASSLAVGVYYLLVRGDAHHKAHEQSETRSEEGYWETFRQNREMKKYVDQKVSEAKKQGVTGDQLEAVRRKATDEQRQVKRAGQDAALKAREAAKAKIGM